MEKQHSRSQAEVRPEGEQGVLCERCRQPLGEAALRGAPDASMQTIEEMVTGKKLEKSLIPASEITIDQSHREFVGSQTPEQYDAFIRRIIRTYRDMEG